MTGRAVGAIAHKDLAAFGRDRFFVLLTVLSLVVYPAVFWLLPSSVDETLRLGVAPAEVAQLLDTSTAGSGAGDRGAADGAGSDAGLAVVPFDDADSLTEGVLAGDGDIVAGLVFSDDFLRATAAGEQTTVQLLLPTDLPGSVRTAMQALVSETAYAVAGEPPPVDPATEAVVLGVDRTGDQVPLRDELRPLMAFFVLLVETLALAALVASEIQQRTVTAVLVTPASVVDFLTAKGLVGTAVAFVEATVIMALVGGLATGAPILLLALLLGAALVTGLGMIAGAYGRDFIAVLFTSMLFLVPLMVPAFAVLFPGSAATWVQVLPSYPLVDTIVAVSTEGAGWAETAPSLLALLGWCVVVFAAGALVLGRKVVTL